MSAAATAVTSSIPLYLNWEFWAVVNAALAIVLSQAPPITLWFKPKRIEIHVPSRIGIGHKVGNANVGLIIMITNTGGRNLSIRSMHITLSRDGKFLGQLPAQNYFESFSSQSTVLLTPFLLKPGETWSKSTNFLGEFDRSTEKSYRENESLLKNNIHTKFKALPPETKALPPIDQERIEADPALVQPFINMFNNMFIWLPGEYVVELSINTDPSAKTFRKKYRFTLFESDSSDLQKQIEFYKYGEGIYYMTEQQSALHIPITLADT